MQTRFIFKNCTRQYWFATHAIFLTIPISSLISMELMFSLCDPNCGLTHHTRICIRLFIMLYQPLSYYCKATQFMLQPAEQSIFDELLLSTISIEQGDFCRLRQYVSACTVKAATILDLALPIFLFPIFCCLSNNVLLFHYGRELQLHLYSNYFIHHPNTPELKTTSAVYTA